MRNQSLWQVAAAAFFFFFFLFNIQKMSLELSLVFNTISCFFHTSTKHVHILMIVCYVDLVWITSHERANGRASEWTNHLAQSLWIMEEIQISDCSKMNEWMITKKKKEMQVWMTFWRSSTPLVQFSWLTRPSQASDHTQHNWPAVS